jgi:hypothetical protein
MAVNPARPACEGGQWCQALNASGSTIVAGTGVILSAVPLPSPVAGAEPGPGIAAFEFTLPLGATTTSASLGIVVSEDIASGDVGYLAMAGVIAARSDGTGGAFLPLTLDALGRLKLATSGHEVLALGLASPVGGAIWCRVVPPFLM